MNESINEFGKTNSEIIKKSTENMDFSCPHPIEPEPTEILFGRDGTFTNLGALLVSFTIISSGMFGVASLASHIGVAKEDFRNQIYKNATSNKAASILMIPFYYINQPAIDIAYWANEKGLGKLIFGFGEYQNVQQKTEN